MNFRALYADNIEVVEKFNDGDYKINCDLQFVDSGEVFRNQILTVNDSELQALKERMFILR